MTRRLKINILFLHAGAEQYGADKILIELISGIDRNKFNPLVILPNTGPLLTNLESLNVPVNIIDLGVLRRKYFNIPGICNRIFYLIAGLLKITLVVRQNCIDIIHTNTSAILVGGIIARLFRIPHIWHIHEIIEKPRTVWKVLSYIIPRLSTKVVAVSHAVRDHMIRGNALNELKTVVIHNGIDMSPFGQGNGMKVRKEYDIKNEDILVGMVGRVNSWKGQAIFIDVAKIVLENHKNVRFLMVGGTFQGEETLFTFLKKRIESEGLTGKVFLSDYRSDIPDVLDAMDIFVLPSMQPDPFPTVVLEAMASGKAVVSFAHGGVMEMIVHRETGLLVPVSDKYKLAEALSSLIDRKALRIAIGEQAKITCQKNFSKHAFIEQFSRLYATSL